MTKEKVSLTVPALTDYVAVVRLAVSGIASRMNFPVDDIEDIKIAVSEACNNAVQHAYDGASDVIYVDCFVDGPTLEILVRDEGKGFDPVNTVSKKQDPDNNDPFGLGLGLTFIKNLMDESDVTSIIGKGTTVRMIKKVPEGSTSIAA